MKKRAWTASSGGINWSLFNPFSALMGTEDKYIGVFRPMFGNTEAGARHAHVLEKSLWILGTAYLAMKAKRNLMTDDLKTLEGDDDRNPTHGFTSRMSTTMIDDLSGAEPAQPEHSPAAGGRPRRKRRKGPPGAPGQAKTASRRPAGSYDLTTTSPINTTIGVALPLLALGSGVYLANKSGKKGEHRYLEQQLNDSIDKKRRYVNRLIKARAQLAKGNISDEELDAILGSSDANYFSGHGMTLDKAAEYRGPNVHSVWRTVLSAPFLIAAAAGVLSLHTSYNYFSYNDPDNVKYRAAKKALREYERAKTVRAPINIHDSNSDQYFEDIDKVPGEEEREQRKQRADEEMQRRQKLMPARELPEKPAALSPLSVTL